MTPYFENSTTRIYNADCLDAMPHIDLVDAVITDPPYGISFMNKNWDHGVPGIKFWSAVYDRLKPGGYLLAFGSARTHHRLACAIEDAKFEIRDCIMWVFGSGFPKSHNLSKSIDRHLGLEREVIGQAYGTNSTVGKTEVYGGWGGVNVSQKRIKIDVTAPSSDAAKKYEGWGTNIKPCYEPIIMARKPPDGNSLAENVLEYGTGGLNISACRLENDKWIGNFMHDGSDLITEKLHGNASFFYAAKATRKERDKGLHELPLHTSEELSNRKPGSAGLVSAHNMMKGSPRRNIHPCVKPIALLRTLCRLVTPENGTILDPFVGSGSTLLAAHAENYRSIGIEIEEKYCEIARARAENCAQESKVCEYWPV